MVNSRDAEPWSFGEEVEQIARNYVKLRYRMMPYIYSAFHQAAETGLPVMRSLALEYTHDEAVYDNRWQHQYLFGDSIMVAPVESTKELCKVYLPAGTWYNLFTDEHYEGAQEVIAECPMWQLPLYVRGGSIVPMQSDVASLKQAPETELKLHVYLGEGSYTYHHYEDDGSSFDYEKGSYHQRDITLDSDARTLSFGASSGATESHFKTVRVFFHGADEVAGSSKAEHRFFTPITGIDTFYTDKGQELKIDALPSVVMDYPAMAHQLQF